MLLLPQILSLKLPFPLSIGVVGAVLAPILAAVAAIAALVTECSIAVEREEAENVSEQQQGDAEDKVMD